ncbi:MAG: hypothetical protein RLZZ393_948 [Pseudomonadota bacterium]
MNLNFAAIRHFLVPLFGALALAACGGGGSDTSSSSGTTVKYSVGGTVTGLAGTVVLQLNGSEALSVSANGSFTFATTVASGGIFQVVVKTQPTGQVCVLDYSSGYVTANITTLGLTCAPATYTVAGTLSGLAGTVVLQNNAGDNLTLASNGPFQFATAVTSFTTYSVTVQTQPAGQTCWVLSGAGTSSSPVTGVQVNCAATTTTATISGGIAGLTSGGLVLRLSRGGSVVESLPTVSPGSTGFAFTTALTTGDSWVVSVATQPSSPKQTCTVANGAGNIVSSSISTVQVSCTTNLFSVGGSIIVPGGSLAAGLVLQDNLGDDLAVPAGAGAFVFATPLTAPSNYAVSVKQQPSGQTCTLERPQGLVVASGDVTNVVVTCIANTMVVPLNGTYTLNIGGTSLRGYLSLFADGTYVLGLHQGDAACNSTGLNTNGNGVEYGVYNWNQATGAFRAVTVAADTNDKCGFASGAQLASGALSKDGAGLLTGTLSLPGGLSGNATLTPVASTSGQLLGAWTVDRLGFVVYGADNTVFQANSQSAQNYPSLVAGIEDFCLSGAASASATGSYQVGMGSGCATGSLSAVDTNGTAGLSAAVGIATAYTVTGDSLSTQATGKAAVVSSRIKLN